LKKDILDSIFETRDNVNEIFNNLISYRHILRAFVFFTQFHVM